MKLGHEYETLVTAVEMQIGYGNFRVFAERLNRAIMRSQQRRQQQMSYGSTYDASQFTTDFFEDGWFPNPGEEYDTPEDASSVVLAHAC